MKKSSFFQQNSSNLIIEAIKDLELAFSLRKNLNPREILALKKLLNKLDFQVYKLHKHKKV